MMSKIKLIVLSIVGVIIFIIVLIDKLYIKPRYEDNFKHSIEISFERYIVYKNNHRGLYLYLSKYWNSEEQRKLSLIDETSAFNKPDESKSDYISEVLMTNIELFDKSTIGDRIQKLPNSNKCYLYKKDSIFKYNCHIIPNEIRELLKIEEWQQNEIGFWKKE